jgi:hypothetical protein
MIKATEHEEFIGEGDYDIYKAKMNLAQLVHVALFQAASRQLSA